MTSITEATVVTPVTDVPVIVDSRLFTDRVTAASIALAESGRRNLKNPDLALFYKANSIPSAKIEDKFDDDVAKRREAGLPPVSSQEFVSQLSSDDSELFLAILTAAGLELEIEDDLKSDTELGINVSPVGQITPENVRLRLQSKSKTAEDHLHLLEKEPLTLADTDIDIQDRVQRIKQYLRDYLK